MGNAAQPPVIVLSNDNFRTLHDPDPPHLVSCAAMVLNHASKRPDRQPGCNCGPLFQVASGININSPLNSAMAIATESRKRPTGLPLEMW